MIKLCWQIINFNDFQLSSFNNFCLTCLQRFFYQIQVSAFTLPLKTLAVSWNIDLASGSCTAAKSHNWEQIHEHVQTINLSYFPRKRCKITNLKGGFKINGVVSLELVIIGGILFNDMKSSITDIVKGLSEKMKQKRDRACINLPFEALKIITEIIRFTNQSD